MKLSNLKPESIICPRCERESFNKDDIKEEYCSVCGYHALLNLRANKK